MADAQDPRLIIPVSALGWKDARPEKVNKESVVAKAGTRVTCPKCRGLVARFRSDLFTGMRVSAEHLEFERGQLKHTNDKAECRTCGTPYMKFIASIKKGLRIYVHTEFGWL